ncbi:MAG: hypothetical protein ACI87E_000060 [Mariniblastus sp.]|jgi:hypothetical protein
MLEDPLYLRFIIALILRSESLDDLRYGNF